jgi:uncharacterized protein (TIGR03437 family)
MRFAFAAVIAAVFSLSGLAAPNRIAGALDSRQMQALPGNTHRLASAQFDRGAADAALPMNYVVLLTKRSAAQQTDLDLLLRDRQNPSSPNFHAWLSPEQFAERFGLSLSDQSKIVSWLTGEGMTVHAPARARNWIAFSGTAGQISRTFHTSIHRYEVNGEMHFANATDPSVPAAMAGLVGGFTGLHDFRPKPQARLIGTPDFTSGKSHYLTPGDFSIIYDVAPLAQAGYDGTGQSIAVVGESDILASDISSFRSDFGLAANAPRQVLFGADPGFTGAELESNLDLEWTGAVAPKATIYYVYATDAFNALIYAVAENVAPVISVSYAVCENDSSPVFRSVAQQANAQGITIVAAAGDAGGAGCDIQGDLSLATHGSAVQFPSNLPEVTGMGGTMFNEGSVAYWATSNSTTGASAVSYIPEVVWNETSPGSGLGAGGGGASASIPKPDWQTGPGVPSDGARDVPDLALSSAGHDAYLITYQGNNLYGVGGTSAAAPSMSGILALLNQYVVKQGLQKTAGLGNINPQLYRMALTVPAAFHDIVSGNNDVPCLQGSPVCATGSYGYAAGPGYDQATGIGSVDANVLVASWGQAVSPISVTLTSSAAKVTVNDTVTVSATVAPAGQGVGTPTGTVSFLTLEQSLGSGTLTNMNGQQTVSVTIPAWQLGVGTSTVVAQYAGNAAFSAGGASVKIQATLPTTPGVTAIGAQVPGPVFAFQTGTQPMTWQADMTLQELAGVPAVLTGFTIDGQTQPLTQYFPSPDIPAGGTLTGTIVLTSLSVPVIKTFGFTGTDLSGSTWSRQVQVQFRGLINEEQVNFNLWATPLTIQQNPGAPTNCQWPQQITLDEITGYELHVIGLVRGSVDIGNTIAAVFGTTRLAPWGSLQGTLCWTPSSTPSSDLLQVILADDFGDELFQEVNVNFTAPAGSAVQLSASPAAVSLKPPVVSLFPVPQTLTVNLSDKSQPWTATVFPANRTTTWLTLSQYAGTGPATLTLQTNGTGFEPGVYRATIVLQSPNSVPQYLAVPVMFVNTPTPNGPTVSSVGNALSFTAPTSPGMIMAVYGSQLASGTQSAATLPLGDSLSGTSATVNGYPAPLFYVSPAQLNIQVPYEVGAGPAVLGINNNGQVGGFQFQLSPAAPGIFTVNGATYPTASAKQGAYATIFVTGTGELNQAQPSGVAVATGTPASSLPLPLLPINVTVGGIPALIQFAGSTVGVVGLTQVNFVVPPSVAAGVQPVVVTAGGYASAAANLTVTAP